MKAATTAGAPYSAPLVKALDSAVSVVRSNHALLVEPDPKAEVDADRMLVTSRLAQMRQLVEKEGIDLDQVLGDLATRAIEGMSIEQDAAVSSLKSLMPAKATAVREPYSAQISRETPALFLLGLDLSDSMNEGFAGAKDASQSKLREVEKVLNEVLFQLAIKSGEELPDGEYIVKDYFHLELLGYGGTEIKSMLPKGTAGEEGFAPLSALVANPCGERDGKPVFFDGFKGGGRTPMRAFFQKAQAAMKRWSDEHPADFPPILINITDGMATDGDPVEGAKAVGQISGEDGNALVFNCHLSASGDTTPIAFPQSIDELPKGDEYARKLFEMSSELPPKFLEEAKRMGLVDKDATSARAMAYNCDIDSLVDFLVIGTRGKDTNVE